MTMNTQIIPIKEYLAELHTNGDLSDTEIAEFVGRERTSIWRLRTGKCSATTHDIATRIAQLHAKTFGRKKKKA